MWLKYGVAINGNLVAIKDVLSGKTEYRCFYCNGLLTAKKGKIKQHHFAHTETTCNPVAKQTIPSLPLYDNFHIQLSHQEFQQLKELWREYGNNQRSIITVPFRLVLRKLFKLDSQCLGYIFTDLGKIPVGALSLAQFNEVQEPLLQK